MIKVTYIGHSGFLLETQEANFLFDYYQGEIPQMDKDKPLVVFVSHRHEDHYNPVIFDLVYKYPSVKYVLPKGTQIKKYVLEYEEKGMDLSSYLMLVKKNEAYEIALSNKKFKYQH